MQPGTDVFFAKTLRKRNQFSIEQKLQIYDFKQNNPKESFDKIAKICWTCPLRGYIGSTDAWSNSHRLKEKTGNHHWLFPGEKKINELFMTKLMKNGWPL